jgi:hypothetical protein
LSSYPPTPLLSSPFLAVRRPHSTISQNLQNPYEIRFQKTEDKKGKASSPPPQQCLRETHHAPSASTLDTGNLLGVQVALEGAGAPKTKRGNGFGSVIYARMRVETPVS